VNQHIGRSSGGRTTKIHAVVDGLGNPLYIKLSAGQIHDSTQAIKILSQLSIKDSNIIKFDYVAVNTILLCVCYPIKY